MAATVLGVIAVVPATPSLLLVPYVTVLEGALETTLQFRNKETPFQPLLALPLVFAQLVFTERQRCLDRDDPPLRFIYLPHLYPTPEYRPFCFLDSPLTLRWLHPLLPISWLINFFIAGPISPSSSSLYDSL